MSWNWMKPWARGADAQSTDGPDQEIDEELMFHLRSLVDDELGKGTTFDEAWDRARGRFGSLRYYADACRGIASGNRKFLQVSLVLLLVLSGTTTGWLLMEVRELRQEHLKLVASVSHVSASRTGPEDLRDDLTGRVVDRRGEPIGNARVAVILKTWPGGWYRQDAFATTTDAEGAFLLAGLIPRNGQYAVHSAVMKPGYALTSTYRLIEEGSRPDAEPVVLQCDEAATITLVLHDENGVPVANARVTPHSRISRTGASHLVYFQASEPFQISSDAEGRVGMGCFERGDQAEVYVQLPGHDWELLAIEIPQDTDTVVIARQSS